MLALLLLAVLLGGCAKFPDPNKPLSTRPPLSTDPLISRPASTNPAADLTAPTEATQPPPSLEPVARLTGATWQTLPQLLSVGEGNVLVCRNDYQNGQGIINELEIFNVYEDQVLVRVENDSPREPVVQQFPDGCFVLKDPRSNTFYVYDRNLQITRQYSVVNTDGYFSYDRTHYYFVDQRVLYRMDLTTGNYGRMALEADLRLESLVGVHPDRDILVAKVYLSHIGEQTGIGVIDCKSGKILLLNSTVSHLWLDGDTFYGAVTNDHVYGSDICYGSLSGGTLLKASTSLLGSDTASYTMLPGSGILLHRTVDENNLSTTVYDLSRNGISSKLAQYGYLTSTLGAVYLRQEQLIFGICPDGEAFSPVVIDPKVLRYEKSLSLHKEIWPALVDQSILLAYQHEQEGPALPDNLHSLRQQADKLENQYGIRIMMESQVILYCDSYAAVKSGQKVIADALNALDRTLSLYPEGFFTQFRNSIGEGGIYLCLTGRIQGPMDPVGNAVKSGDRYVIALDITAPQPDRTIHHELWHAIEMKISTDSFDSAKWNANNPKDFLYYGHYDAGYQHLTQWTYAQSGSQCYFVDAYSCINAREDRARLMEYAMSEDGAAVLRSPALRNKLALMSETLRAHFNTEGWQTPHWEQYL